MTFWCAKKKQQMDEPCSTCEDCPGDLSTEACFRRGIRNTMSEPDE